MVSAMIEITGYISVRTTGIRSKPAGPTSNPQPSRSVTLGNRLR